MAGTIRTYQKCRVCGALYPSSDGVVPIECCQTYPTKYFIRIKNDAFYFNRAGRSLRDWFIAQRALHEMQGQIAAGTFQGESYKRQSKTSFKLFWAHFRELYMGKPATKDKLSSIQKHLSPFWNSQMRDITKPMVDSWWVGLSLSPRYKNDILVWLKSFFKYAQDLDVIDKIPIPRTVKSVKVPFDGIDFYTEEEQLKVLSKTPVYDQQIFDFLFLTGVRVNEACALMRSDVDWNRGIIQVKYTVKRDKSIGPVKNQRARVIPLSSDIRACLKPGKVTRLSEYQFVNKWGRRYHAEYLRRIFKKACEAAGLKPIKLKNATRHSFGMGLLRKGYDIWQTSKAMNHTTIKMTENYVTMLGGDIAEMYGRGQSKKRKAE